MATLQQVVFKLDNEEYGLDIIKVNGIEKYQEVVKVPNEPDYIKGIINLRGEVVPIFSLRDKFKLTPKVSDENTRIIIVLSQGMKLGFLVDSVSEIMNIEEEQIENMPRIMTGIDRKYIKDVAKVDNRMVILIDVDLIINDEERASIEETVVSAE
jgi:purine-binding chemotaxis protein CheW